MQKNYSNILSKCLSVLWNCLREAFKGVVTTTCTHLKGCYHSFCLSVFYFGIVCLLRLLIVIEITIMSHIFIALIQNELAFIATVT